MRDIQIIYQNPKKVLQHLSRGEVDAIENAVDQITDEFMIYGLRGGLIDELSKAFPDPRREKEISLKIILTASEVSMIVYCGDIYAIFSTKFLVGYRLRLPKEIQMRLYELFPSGVG